MGWVVTVGYPAVAFLMLLSSDGGYLRLLHGHGGPNVFTTLGGGGTTPDFFVAAVSGIVGGGVNGSPSGDGSINRPWDLQTAFNGGNAGQVVPGKVVGLRSGTITGQFVVNISGNQGNQITFLPYFADGNWWDYPAKIQNSGSGNLVGTIRIASSYLTFQELEVFCSTMNRKTATAGSGPPDINCGYGIGNSSSGTEYKGIQTINCLVHDVADGLGQFGECTNALQYGNLVYNNGWDGPSTDRGHGHSTYCQNDITVYPGSVRTLTQNIFANCFSDEFTLYGTNARSDNMHLDGNIGYNAGAVSAVSWAHTLNWTSGGHVTQGGVTGYVKNSVFYNPDSFVGTFGNYFDSRPANDEAPFNSLTITNNRFLAYAASGSGCEFDGTFNGTNTIASNTFLRSIASDGSTITPANFPANSYITSKPSSNEVILFVNAYRAGRGHLAILNWLQSSTVAVDISPVVAVGKNYRIMNSADYFGTVTLSGTYSGGTVAVPMTGMTVAAPLGTNVPQTAVNTGPEFGAFIVAQTN